MTPHRCSCQLSPPPVFVSTLDHLQLRTWPTPSGLHSALWLAERAFNHNHLLMGYTRLKSESIGWQNPLIIPEGSVSTQEMPDVINTPEWWEDEIKHCTRTCHPKGEKKLPQPPLQNSSLPPIVPYLPSSCRLNYTQSFLITWCLLTGSTAPDNPPPARLFGALHVTRKPKCHFLPELFRVDSDITHDLQNRHESAAVLREESGQRRTRAAQSVLERRPLQAPASTQWKNRHKPPATEHAASW